MYRLPLFPLNTVLFPGMPLHLHIFEERYKQMISQCLDESQAFGVVLIRKGVEALGPLADPYPVGCTARIVKNQRLDQGRMNLLAVGEKRFRILSLDRTSAPYLVGLVEDFPWPEVSPEVLAPVADQLKPRFVRYLQQVAGEGAEQPELGQIPDDPAALANLAAIALQIPADQKQALLAIEGSLELLTSLGQIYRKEIALLQSLDTDSRPPSIGHFSVN
jgi:Lon protease-like protein